MLLSLIRMGMLWMWAAIRLPKQPTNEDNMSKINYSHMLVRKISGIPVSRHCSEGAAINALRRKDSRRDPLELREYSAEYYAKMK
jgi:hypothetical protein